MISNISVDNYLSYKSGSLNLKPLTILYGPNGAGKTNILKSPLLIKQSLHYNFGLLVLLDKYIALSIDSMQNHEGNITLSFQFSLSDGDEFFDVFCYTLGMLENYDHIDRFEVEVKLITEDVARDRYTDAFKAIKGMNVEMITFFSSKADEEYAGKAVRSSLNASILCGHADTYHFSLSNVPCECKRDEGLESGYPFVYKDMEFNLNIGHYYGINERFTLERLREEYGDDLKIIRLIYKAIQQLFNQVEFIGSSCHSYLGDSNNDYEVVPFTEVASRRLSTDNIETVLGNPHDEELDEEKLGFNVEGKKVALIDAVKDWVRHIGLGELEVIRDESKTCDNYYYIKINGRYIQNLGLGINKIMPIIVGGLNNQYCGTLLLEQPEIGISPKLQSELVDFILDGVVKYGKQVVIETHSGYIMNQIIKRATENDDIYDLVQFYCIRKDKDDNSEVLPVII